MGYDNRMALFNIVGLCGWLFKTRCHATTELPKAAAATEMNANRQADEDGQERIERRLYGLRSG